MAKSNQPQVKSMQVGVATYADGSRGPVVDGKEYGRQSDWDQTIIQFGLALAEIDRLRLGLRQLAEQNQELTKKLERLQT